MAASKPSMRGGIWLFKGTIFFRPRLQGSARPSARVRSPRLESLQIGASPCMRVIVIRVRLRHAHTTLRRGHETTHWALSRSPDMAKAHQWKLRQAVGRSVVPSTCQLLVPIRESILLSAQTWPLSGHRAELHLAQHRSLSHRAII